MKPSELVPGQRFRLKETGGRLGKPEGIAVRIYASSIHFGDDAISCEPPPKTKGEFSLLWMNPKTHTIYVFRPKDEVEPI